MSNIYINEPPTCGKILLTTTFGDLQIELWSKEAPKASKNFLQLCMEGYYDNTLVHRILKGRYAEAGDPKGTGYTWESVYGDLFKDEIHSRLRFVRRGLVACIAYDQNHNGSQFMFTLGALPEFINKRTIFAQVTGDTIFNLLRLDSAITDDDGRPEFCCSYKILKAEILFNPFNDVIPRQIKCVKLPKTKDKTVNDIKPVKNFKLLSFGDEAIDDENEVVIENKKFSGKSRSIHDVLGDSAFTFKSTTTAPADHSVESGEKFHEKSATLDNKTSILAKVKEKLRTQSIGKKSTFDDDVVNESAGTTNLNRQEQNDYETNHKKRKKDAKTCDDLENTSKTFKKYKHHHDDEKECSKKIDRKESDKVLSTAGNDDYVKPSVHHRKRNFRKFHEESERERYKTENDRKKKHPDYDKQTKHNVDELSCKDADKPVNSRKFDEESEREKYKTEKNRKKRHPNYDKQIKDNVDELSCNDKDKLVNSKKNDEETERGSFKTTKHSNYGKQIKYDDDKLSSNDADKPVENLRREYEEVKTDLKKNVKKMSTKSESRTSKNVRIKQDPNIYKEYKQQYENYKALSKLLPKKGVAREESTLKMLEKFKKKMYQSLEKYEKNKNDNDDDDDNHDDDDHVNKEINSGDWMSHKLKFSESVIHAKDANLKSDDWFDIYDPRNPINRRRRGEDTTKLPPKRMAEFKYVPT